MNRQPDEPDQDRHAERHDVPDAQRTADSQREHPDNLDGNNR